MFGIDDLIGDIVESAVYGLTDSEILAKGARVLGTTAIVGLSVDEVAELLEELE